MKIDLTAQTKTGLLKGYIIEGKENNGIYLANIIILNSSLGTTSNQKGYFEISLPPGKYLVEARVLGYKPLFKRNQNRNRKSNWSHF